MTGDTSSMYLNRFVSRIGLKTVSERLSDSEHPIVFHPIVLWALSFSFFDIVVLQAYKYVSGYPVTFIYNPAWLIQPVFAVFAAAGTVHLYNRYDATIELLDIEGRPINSDIFNELAPKWLRVGVYIVVLGYQIIGSSTLIGVDTMMATGGIAEVIGTVGVVPIGYAPIFAEFIIVYLGIMIFLPIKIHRSDFKVHFLHPENLGGLRPIGELAKLAYYMMVAGLLGFLVFTYAPSILGNVVKTSYPEPGIVTNTAFTVVWLLTIGLLAHALYRLHLFMKRERERELLHLDRQAREVSDEPFDIRGWEVQDEDEFEDIRERAKQVNATREYPTTFAMWSQILITALLPQAIQFILIS